MPTGITAGLTKETTLKEYAMICARMFFHQMRDASGPIPEKFEPSTYHDEALKKSRQKLKAFLDMEENEKESTCHRNHEEKLQACIDHKEEQNKENEIYLRLKIMVEAWDAPTSGHKGLRDTMLQQLDISIETHSWEKPDLIAADEWYLKELRALSERVTYHQEEHDKEHAAVATNNEWLAQLRASL